MEVAIVEAVFESRKRFGNEYNNVDEY